MQIRQFIRPNNQGKFDIFKFTIQEPHTQSSDLFIGKFWASRFDLIGVYDVL